MDTRTRANFVARHIPGAVHLVADDQLSNRIGLALPSGVPIILQLDDPAEYPSIFYALARVGYDNVLGYLAENLDMWETYGLPTMSGDVKDIDSHELDAMLHSDTPPFVLDVREPWEFRNGHIPGAKLIPLSELQSRFTELDPEQPVAVVCHTGNRSQTAGAILAQKGFKKVYNLREGTASWQYQGLPLER